jgi:cytochrome c556
MIRTVLAVTVLAFGVSAVVAQGDPIAARKALMKANGDQNRAATEMLDGKRPFDVEAAKRVLTTFADSGEKSKALYPDTSKAGDTAALPAIWENKADFEAKLTKFASDSRAAAAAVTSMDAFKAQIAEIRKSCGGCHTPYRKKAS